MLFSFYASWEYMDRNKHNFVKGHFSEKNIKGSSGHFSFLNIYAFLSCKSTSHLRSVIITKEKAQNASKIQGGLDKEKHTSNSVLILVDIGLISGITDSFLLSQMAKVLVALKSCKGA